MGFGGLFKQQSQQQNQLIAEQNSLTNSANEFGLLAGQMQKSADNQQAQALRDQADVAIQQTAQDVALQQRNIENAAGTQAEQYLSSGVQTIGTPIAVMNETNQLGQMKINSMLQRAELQANLLRTQADYTQQQGLESELGALGSADINSLQNKVSQTQQQIEWSQARQQYAQGLIGSIVPSVVQGGISILGGLI